MSYYLVTGTVFVLRKAFLAHSTVSVVYPGLAVCRCFTPRRAGSIQGQYIWVLAVEQVEKDKVICKWSLAFSYQ